MAEFRTALREEIESASRNESSGAVPLVNGRRIAQVGGAFQYIFDIESALNLPGDAPGDLYLPGCPPVAVSVVSVDGMAITLSVPQDIGVFVPQGRLQSNLTFLMRKLIERIENRAAAENQVGDRIMGVLPVSGEPVEPSQDPFPLNEHQRAAVASSLGRNTTFIWGPPGTGKSRTIGAIAWHLYQQGRSVLLVSHTNIAVDGALSHIADALDRAVLQQGHVLRIGEPKDPKISSNPELLLRTHVDRRSEELALRREALIAERINLADKVGQLCRSIDIYEWALQAQGDIATMTREVQTLQSLEAELRDASAEEARLAAMKSHWATAASKAREACRDVEELANLENQLAQIGRQRETAEGEAREADQRLSEAERILVTAVAIAPLRSRMRMLPSNNEQVRNVEESRLREKKARDLHRDCSGRLSQAVKLLVEARACGALMRLWRGLPAPEEQQKLVDALKARTESAAKQAEETEKELLAAVQMLTEVTDLTSRLAPHRGVPDADVQKRAVDEQRRQVATCAAKLEKLARAADEAAGVRQRCIAAIQSFYDQYTDKPDNVMQKANAHAAQLDSARSRSAQLACECSRRRLDSEQILSSRLAVLREWNLTSDSAGTAEAMLVAVQQTYDLAVTKCGTVDIGALRTEKDELNKRVVVIDAQVSFITAALKQVEGLVIAEARIVATTLTRAYLRDSIQNRRFDTVILDEASMAPIPALWVAAGLADANAVVVGDFKQLPPIVISEHPLAKQWLGRDVFDKAGLIATESAPEHLVSLLTQYRMHPSISLIPNTLVYEGRLVDADGTKNDGSLAVWHRSDWEHDHPVLLVDTGPLGAWVTSVSRGMRRASRLNFLSATVCADLAERLLRDDRPAHAAGENPRILIVCPYRPHAKLLDLLLHEQGISGEVRAGTAHSFQGSEADVVILDLVNDEPHWRVRMFMPDMDDTTRRLLNVALTRARRRLIIVGDFDYIAKRAKKAFLGKRLIPFLISRYPRVNAVHVVPAGLAARAAKAQSVALGGEVEAPAARTVVTQEQFYPMLRWDLAHAKKRVVIYSAFITQTRLALLEPPIRAAVERHVQIYVVTKAQTDRDKGELREYRMLERTLGDWGAIVVHKRGMHEKLVFIDDHILWSGSLNPLSFSNTQEIMERRDSVKVVADFADTLRLDSLVGEYDEGPPSCPICGNEVVASEGDDKPFYWRCLSPDCYRRDIDQAPLKDGLIVCANCGGEVEFGEWGSKAAWRCTGNRHHHQVIATTHLRLPKMRALIPKADLRRLEKLLSRDRAGSPSRAGETQPGLFDSGP